MTKYHAMLLISVALTAVALVSFKVISVDARGEVSRILCDARFYVAGAVYGAAFLMWIISASRLDYTMLVYSNATGLIISGLIGYFIFDETITAPKVVAYILIASGVVALFEIDARS